MRSFALPRSRGNTCPAHLGSRNPTIYSLRRCCATERLFSDLGSVNLPAFFEKLFRDGCPIYQKKLKTHLPEGARVRICTEDGRFFAIGEVVERAEGSAIKSVKMFEL